MLDKAIDPAERTEIPEFGLGSDDDHACDPLSNSMHTVLSTCSIVFGSRPQSDE